MRVNAAPEQMAAILSQTLDFVSEGVSIIDEQGRIIFLNKAAEILEELSLTDVLGRHLKEIYRLNEETSLQLKPLPPCSVRWPTGLTWSSTAPPSTSGDSDSPDDIFLDPLIKPLSVGDQSGIESLDSVRALKHEYPDVHLICGLSNISFGLPKRRLLNRTFLAMSMAAGMDAFILDPLDTALMATFAAAGALAGRDKYCMNYITGVRAGRITD